MSQANQTLSLPQNPSDLGPSSRSVLTKSLVRPVLLVILDGVGLKTKELSLSANLSLPDLPLTSTLPFQRGDAVASAHMPNLWRYLTKCPGTLLKAHGTAVGMPTDLDMGNSEVGHNTLGAGRAFAQGAKRVEDAFSSQEIFESKGWKELVESDSLRRGENAFHFCGLFSDGNVHSNVQHLFNLLIQAKKEGVKKAFLHLLLDGRDVSPHSSLDYAKKLESFLQSMNDSQFHCQVASGGGRSQITMDRYNANWSMVEKGYRTHILGEGKTYPNLIEALKDLKKGTEGNFSVGDQDCAAFVIADSQGPVGRVKDGDSFLFFNFRGDRAIEFCRTMTQTPFSEFNRPPLPQITFAGMLEYDGDLHIPPRYLVAPPTIDGTLSELMSKMGLRQFACSETQKFGHVTFFWNGNRSGKYNDDLETYVEIPSEVVDFAQRPWMQCAAITDRTIQAIHNQEFEFARINFANADMVGHTGDFAATVAGLNAVDLCLGRLEQACQKSGVLLLVTADHGNAEEMYELDPKTGEALRDGQGRPKSKTSHTLNPVPFLMVNPESLDFPLSLNPWVENGAQSPGLANVAATILECMEIPPPPWFEPSLWVRGYTAHPLTSIVTLITWESLAPHERSVMVQSPPCPATALRYSNLFHRLGQVIHTLRVPQIGCPWDLEQTHESLKRFLIEESYETLEAIDNCLHLKDKSSFESLADELGDVLLQIVLHAQIGSENQNFDLTTVCQKIISKMLERHPHVFVPSGAQALSAQDVEANWESIKARTQNSSPSPSEIPARSLTKSVLEKVKKRSSLPTLNYAAAISKESFKLGFAWQTLPETFNDVISEIEELKQELFKGSSLDSVKIRDEWGDVIYALANLAVYLNQAGILENLDLDSWARSAVQKFTNRFATMEEILRERGEHLHADSAEPRSLDEWNELWKEAKRRRYR